MIASFSTAARATALIALLFIASTASFRADATATSPALAIESVEVDYTKEDGVFLRLDGVFPFEDMIDLAYPLQLFVRSKETFLCFSVRQGPMGGELKELKDAKNGLTDEIVDLIGLFAQPDSEAQILSVSPRRMEVMLSPHFPSGDAEAQLFVLYRGAPIYSNAVQFKIHKENW